MSIIRYRRQLPNVLGNIFDDNMYEDKMSPASDRDLPFVNIRESEDGFIIELAAPGYNKSDFNIEIDKNTLTISSDVENKATKEEEDQYVRKEFEAKSFARRFQISKIVNRDEITAKYENGVLLVFVPKIEEAKPKPVRRVEVF